MCVWVCVCGLLVLSSSKHTHTVIANCLGLCQESWWQQKRKIDGLLCQHSSFILSLPHSVCVYASQYVFPHLLPASPASQPLHYCLFLNSSIPSTSLSPSDPRSSVLSFLFCFLPCCFNVLSSCFVYLSTGLFSADWTDLALEDCVGRLYFACV